MTINGLTTCVDYAEFLVIGLKRWMFGLESLTVVTTHSDVRTLAAARAFGAKVFVTDAFTRDGAAFNKGRAMEEARQEMPWSDWILFFDADVVPPSNWNERLSGIQSGSLYGCHRFEAQPDDVDDWAGTPNITGDAPGVGYFQLFHSGDPVVQDTPLLETHWAHAGNYDNAFMDLWRKKGKQIKSLPFRLAHVGERENWFGRGNSAAFNAMKQERWRHGGRWEHERIGAQS